MLICSMTATVMYSSFKYKFTTLLMNGFGPDYELEMSVVGCGFTGKKLKFCHNNGDKMLNIGVRSDAGHILAKKS